jgi:hypothetical protein
MPPKRKAAVKKDESEKADPKKKSKSSAQESTDKGDESATVEVAGQDAGSKSDVQITSSKACQAFAKRHVELEVSEDAPL